MRLYVLVEGLTEERFAKRVLTPGLAGRGVYAYPFQVETSRDRYGRKRRGGGYYRKWRNDLLRLVKQHPGQDVRFTTLFDLYHLPTDFPKYEDCAKEPSTLKRVAMLEAALAEDIGDWRLVPYLQRHEFETLVLASLDQLEELLDEENDVQGAKALKAVVSTSAPEEVNDGDETAPSRRLQGNIPSYRKALHGPLATESAGLPALRAACSRFNDWVTKLENL